LYEIPEHNDAVVRNRKSNASFVFYLIMLIRAIGDTCFGLMFLGQLHLINLMLSPNIHIQGVFYSHALRGGKEWTFIQVTNRYENKYLLSTEVFGHFKQALDGIMNPDLHNRQGQTYSINNLYYDTPDSYLIRTSLSKPRYKEKLRLRSYGIPEKDSKVYVEIKKKCSGLVSKRRSAMTLEQAYTFLESGQLPPSQPKQNLQVLGELQYVLQNHELSPALFLSYDRLAYSDSQDLRVSFDTNIHTRRSDLRLELGTHGSLLLDPDIWLMEIKVARSIPLWLCRMLSEYEVRPTSFSKYGYEYTQTLTKAHRILTFPHESNPQELEKSQKFTQQL
jgi:hypothetical protein